MKIYSEYIYILISIPDISEHQLADSKIRDAKQRFSFKSAFYTDQTEKNWSVINMNTHIKMK